MSGYSPALSYADPYAPGGALAVGAAVPAGALNAPAILAPGMKRAGSHTPPGIPQWLKWSIGLVLVCGIGLALRSWLNRQVPTTPHVVPAPVVPAPVVPAPVVPAPVVCPVCPASLQVKGLPELLTVHLETAKPLLVQFEDERHDPERRERDAGRRERDADRREGRDAERRERSGRHDARHGYEDSVRPVVIINESPRKEERKTDMWGMTFSGDPLAMGLPRSDSSMVYAKVGDGAF
jgi:hypothetical protein